MLPNDLIAAIFEKASDFGIAEIDRPSRPLLERLLETAFHASFLTEEGRRAGFRVILGRPGDLDGSSFRSNGPVFRTCRFATPRPYTVSEVNKLVPASDPSRAMIGVVEASDSDTGLCIWGLLDRGVDLQLQESRHFNASGAMPFGLIITSLAPGELALSWGGNVIATLRAGNIVRPRLDPALQQCFSAFFGEAAQAFRADLAHALHVDALGEKRWGTRPEDTYIRFLWQILYCVRANRHGGTILLVPSFLSAVDTRLTDRIRIKYVAQYRAAKDELLKFVVKEQHRIEALYLGAEAANVAILHQFAMDDLLLEGVGATAANVADTAAMIASLTAVDGAVVLTDRYEVLGFGAEVIVPSPTLRNVTIVSDAARANVVDIDDFGTRHRSAFRFCSSMESAIALIVSSDGAVRAVRRIGPEVVLWPDINSGEMGL